MNLIHAAVLVMLWSTVSTAWAGVIGLPQQTAKVGVASGGGLFKVYDPNGDTAQALAVQPLQIFVTDWLVGRTKYWLTFYNQQYVLTASEQNIGQAVEQNGMRVLVQQNLALHRYWMPWVGVGFDVNYGEYRLRHHMDSDGYLTQRFADRDGINAGVVFSLTSEWQLSHSLSAGFQIEQVVPLGPTSRSTTATVLFMYNL
jgi:hypothetical protein